jgi:hypothetical protein
MIHYRDIERIAYALQKRLTFANVRKWHYTRVLHELHGVLQPQQYFEIGVRRGQSLALAKCPAAGVDPAYDLLQAPRSDTVLFKQTSDEFFATPQIAAALGGRRIDLAFIDGWHNSEFVIRDFMNTEQYCSPSGAIVIDDVLPRTRDQAVRKPHGRAWTGDVWKAADCLIRHRPDLQLTFIECLPTGLLVVQGLSPEDTTLRDRYGAIEADLISPHGPLMPPRAYRKLFRSPVAGLTRIRSLHASQSGGLA